MATTATAPLGSTERTNQLLSEASKQTGVKAPTFNIDTPSQVANNVSTALTKSSGNPDAPGAVPTAQPGKNLDGTPSGNVASPNPTQPSPQNPTPPQNTGTPSLTDFQDQLKQKYGNVADFLSKSGVQAPSSQGSANAGIKQASDNYDKQNPQQPTTTPAVESFVDPSANPLVDTQLQQLREFLAPQSQTQALNDALSQLKTDQSSLAGLRTELMNTKNIMSGSEQDIMDEVTKAGGTISASLLSNMTIARNRALITQQKNLEDQITTLQDAVNTDTTLVGDEKQMAQQQFANNMSLLKYAQDSYDNHQKAFTDGITHLADNNPQALYQAMVNDPVYAQRVATATGYTPETLKGMASTKQLDNQYKQLQIDKLQQDISAGNLPATTNPDGTPIDPNNQSILAQTGLSLPAFYALTGQSSNLPRDAATRKKAFAEAQSWANQKGIDISTLASQYKAQNDVLQKNIARAANTKVFAGEVAGSADALINVIDQKDLSGGVMGGIFGIGAFKPTNLVALASGKQVNDKLTQKYATQLQAMTNDYAGYLAASRGANSPEMADIQDAANTIANGLNSGSTQAFKEAIQANEQKVQSVVDRAVNDAQKSVWNMFGVGDKFQGSKASSVIDLSSTTFNGLTATGPWGTLTFPDQKSLDAFKKDHQ